MKKKYIYKLGGGKIGEKRRVNKPFNVLFLRAKNSYNLGVRDHPQRMERENGIKTKLEVTIRQSNLKNINFCRADNIPLDGVYND